MLFRSGLMDKLSVRTGGHATSWLSTAYDPRKALDPRYAELVQTRINRIYADFTAKVAAARKSTPQKIDEVAQGRVWTGAQALERKLVDAHGSVVDALDHARARAGIADGEPVEPVGEIHRVAHADDHQVREQHEGDRAERHGEIAGGNSG